MTARDPGFAIDDFFILRSRGIFPAATSLPCSNGRSSIHAGIYSSRPYLMSGRVTSCFLAIRAVEMGLDVIGLDIDPERVAHLRSGTSFVDDITSERLAAAAATGRYAAVSDVAECRAFDVCVITVPTPLRESTPDLSFIEAAAASVGPLVTIGATVILESTHLPWHHRGASRPCAREGQRTSCGERLLGRLQPRAHRSFESELEVGEHTQGRLGYRCLNPDGVSGDLLV